MQDSQAEAAMLIFLPPAVQILGGIALLGAGAATHLVVLDALGVVSLAVGGVRWMRKRGSGARR
jgi:hypothetical protein